MGWSAGTFARVAGSTTWGDDRDASVEILASLHDTHDNDLSDGINACLHKGGQNSATADISMGTNKLTNLGTPSADADAATKLYADSNGLAAGDEWLVRLNAVGTVPNGFTVSAVTNKAVKILATQAGADGGTDSFSTSFSSSKATDSRTLSIANLPAHTHPGPVGAPNFVGGSSGASFAGAAGAGLAYYANTGSTGSGTGHTHTIAIDVEHREFNILVKS